MFGEETLSSGGNCVREMDSTHHSRCGHALDVPLTLLPHSMLQVLAVAQPLCDARVPQKNPAVIDALWAGSSGPHLLYPLLPLKPEASVFYLRWLLIGAAIRITKAVFFSPLLMSLSSVEMLRGVYSI